MTKNLTIHDDFPTKKRPKIEDTLESLEKSFEKLQSVYIKDGLSQQVTLYLKYLVRNPIIPPEYRSLPLMHLLEDCSKDFLLNDLEIVMWRILLEKLVWGEKSRSLKILLLFTAYAAKCNLNLEETLMPLNSFIRIKYPGFQQGYQTWSSTNFLKLSVSLRDFNKAFNIFLNLPVTDIIDYNYYVDDLLHIAPPAGICEKESKLEFEPEIEQEENKLPELLNLNSLFTTNELPIPLLIENWKSIDGTNEIDFEIVESPLKLFHDNGYIVG